MRYWKQPDLAPSFEYARRATAHFSKSFYLSSRLLPRDRQWATFALYAFCRHVDNLADTPRDRSKSELGEELGHLVQELERAYRTGESLHPVLQPFIEVALRYQIPIEYPLELIEGVQMDLADTHYESFDELYVFCYRVAGVVGLMMTHVLGYSSDEAFAYAEKLGIAMQLTNILRDVQEDASMGRLYIPTEELSVFGVKEWEIENGIITPDVRRLIRYQVDRAWQYYKEAQQGITMLDRSSQFAIYAASRIYSGILKKIEARDYNPFLGRVFVPKLSKVGILVQELVRTRIPKLTA